MAIFTRPAGTRSSPTLMGRILPSLIRNKVGFGFKNNKKTRIESGLGLDFGKTSTQTRPVYNIIKKKKRPRYKYYSFTSKNHFPNPNFSPLSRLSLLHSQPPLPLPHSLSLSHLLSPVPPPPHRSNRSLPPSPSYSLIHLAAEIASSSLTTPLTPQSRRRRRSFLPPLSPRLDWKKKGFLLVFRGSVFGVLEELK